MNESLIITIKKIKEFFKKQLKSYVSFNFRSNVIISFFINYIILLLVYNFSTAIKYINYRIETKGAKGITFFFSNFDLQFYKRLVCEIMLTFYPKEYSVDADTWILNFNAQKIILIIAVIIAIIIYLIKIFKQENKATSSKKRDI